MIRRELYIGKIIWNRSKKIKVPGTNKRIRRPRHESEWSVVPAPDLRIRSDELWQKAESRIRWTNEQFARDNGRGLIGRAASSPYLFSVFLKCGACGANLVVVRGRQRRHAAYGCPQYFSRGTCRNSLCIRQDRIEMIVFESLRDKFFAPEVLATIEEFLKSGRNASKTSTDSQSNHESRIRELKAELRNLVVAIAKGKPSSDTILDSIREHELEISRLKMAICRSTRPISPGLLASFARNRLREIYDIVRLDVVKAKVELGKHLSEIVIRPNFADRTCDIEGQWNLLGGYPHGLFLPAQGNIDGNARSWPHWSRHMLRDSQPPQLPISWRIYAIQLTDYSGG